MSSWHPLRRHGLSPVLARTPPVPDPVAWAESNFDFHPDPLQAEVLRSASPRLVLCCSRQWGKSTVTALKALHTAWFHPGSLILVAAPSLRQSGEWMDKTARLLRSLGVHPRGDGRNPNSLLLPNRSRLIGLPGSADTVRGFSAATLLLFDEAAFVPEALFQSLNPTLAVSQGALWLMSTPGAQSGFFYDAWHDGSPLWERFQAPATTCPRIRPGFLESQRLLLGDDVFRREYLCEFTAAAARLLSRDLIEESFVDDPPFHQGRPLWPF